MIDVIEPATDPFKLLVSFHYYRTVDMDDMMGRFPLRPIVFADSGAFSALSQGSPVQLGEYIEWIQRWRHLFSVYSNLDVIGSASGTAANQEKMESAGLSPLPVFHAGNDLKVLEELCERYAYVALGGMVGTKDRNALMRWLIACFKIARKYGTVFHGFGQTNHKILMSLPFYSVDSSTWGSGHRYGLVDLWSDDLQKFVEVQIGDWKGVYARADLIRAHGIDPLHLADRKEYHRSWAIAASAAAWRRYEQFLRRRHGPVFFRGSQESPGLKVYLADTDKTNLVAAGTHLYLAANISDVIDLVEPGRKSYARPALVKTSSKADASR